VSQAGAKCDVCVLKWWCKESSLTKLETDRLKAQHSPTAFFTTVSVGSGTNSAENDASSKP
ncbi:MAG: hypothetical protein WAO93_03430, partial [Orrella sp.]